MSEPAGNSIDLDAQVRRVTQALKHQDGTGASEELIERTVRDCFAEREGAKVKDFVSLLAERSARERLRLLSADDAPGIPG